MQFRSIVALTAGVCLAGCVSGGDSIPTQPPLDAIVSGNPPPPPVSGMLGGGFSIVDPLSAGALSQYNFRIAASYNRNLTTGMNFLEFEPGPAKFKANAGGVVAAIGIIVMTDPATGAQLTVDLTQLIGFTGALFVPCPAGSPANCFVLNYLFAGTIRLASGQTFPATGRFRFRWETP